MTIATSLYNRLNHELQHIQQKRFGDALHYRLSKQGIIFLGKRPASCLARCLECLIRLLTKKMPKLECKFKLLADDVERYLAAEKDTNQLAAFLLTNTLALNVLFDTANKMALAGKIKTSFNPVQYPKIEEWVRIAPSQSLNTSVVTCFNECQDAEVTFDVQPKLEPWTQAVSGKVPKGSKLTYPALPSELMRTITATTTRKGQGAPAVTIQSMKWNLGCKSADYRFSIDPNGILKIDIQPRVLGNTFATPKLYPKRYNVTFNPSSGIRTDVNLIENAENYFINEHDKPVEVLITEEGTTPTTTQQPIWLPPIRIPAKGKVDLNYMIHTVSPGCQVASDLERIEAVLRGTRAQIFVTVIEKSV